jgi:lipoate-protein ligase A
MNNRESSSKANKNQLRGLIEERIAKAKKKAEPPPLSKEEIAIAEKNALEKAAKKAIGRAIFEAKKAERKRLRSKHHVSSE